MPGRQYAVLGPLSSAVRSHAFLGCEVVNGVPVPEQPVVVVWLPESIAGDTEALMRMQRQTAWVERMAHPHIVRVFGLESFEEGWARIVELVDGEPLRVVADRVGRPGPGGAVGERRLSGRFVVRIGLDVAAGLQYAHDFGREANGQPILHGGVRPETIMIGFDGRARISGLGASAFGPHRPVQPGIDGRSYLAPEQLLGGPDSASVQTDVYGLSAVLYELLTGAPPFGDADDVERAVLTEDLTAPYLPEQEQRLLKVLRQGLHRRSAARFQSLADLSLALMDTWAPELPAGHDELAEAMEMAFPSDEFSRINRRDLLESAWDPDVASVLRAQPPPDAEGTPWGSAEPGWSSEWSSEWASGLDVGDEPATVHAAVHPPAGALASSPAASRPVIADAPPAGAPGDPWEGEVPPIPAVRVATTDLEQPDEHDVSPFPDPPPSSEELPQPEPMVDLPEAPKASEEPSPSEAAALTGPVGLGTVLDSERPSQVTRFDRRLGDGSRFALALVLVAAALFVGVLAFVRTFEPPEGLAEPEERHRLPPELLAEIMAVQKEQERPPPPPEASGPERTVIFSVQPPVDVFRGTKPLGRTPLTVPLKAGLHEVRLTDADLAINVYRRIEVPPPSGSDPARIHIELQPATLRLTAPDGADVYLNSRPLGVAPLEPVPVYEGRYLLLVQLRGQRWRQRIDAEPGQTITTKADL
jgi:serine/threonine-protein kinase